MPMPILLRLVILCPHDPSESHPMSMVSLTVNGQSVERDVPDNTLLAFFLREELGLTGTHVGCDTSQCGCCVVRLDGVSVKSCTTLVHQIQDAQVQTVESLAQGEQLHPIQQAFTECHALQCPPHFTQPTRSKRRVSFLTAWTMPVFCRAATLCCPP